MIFVSIKDLKEQLSELAHRVEEGETIVVTQNGKPLFDIVAHRKERGIDLEAGWAYLQSKGIEDPVPFIAEDFDEPLPEDFLLKPLPEAM